jgi:hypothetical protein
LINTQPDEATKGFYFQQTMFELSGKSTGIPINSLGIASKTQGRVSLSTPMSWA